MRELAHLLASRDGWGGRERSIHFADEPGWLRKTFLVSSTRMAQTGTWYPASGGGGPSMFEECDYEPAGLSDAKQHKLLELIDNQLRDVRHRGPEVLATDVEKVHETAAV